MKTTTTKIPCPDCGEMICTCLLNDREYLARQVGKLMRGKAPILSPNKDGVICSYRDEEREALREQLGPYFYCFATPDWFREMIKREYGFPALDVASSHGMEFGKRFYTPEQNGLKQNWYRDSRGGFVFGNPPWNWRDRELDQWVDMAYATSQRGRMVLFVLPVWRRYDWIKTVIQYAEVRFSAVPILLKGFGPMKGKEAGNTNFHNEHETILAIFRKNQKGFLGEWLKP
jgi:hypothetical protein